MPGTDIDHAVRVVTEELPHLAHLPELPARGVGSDGVGRSLAIAAELAVETYAGHWQVTRQPGVEATAARRVLEEDITALSVGTLGSRGPLKVQCYGPLTLAATVRNRRGEPMLSDVSARRDLASILAEGLAVHLQRLTHVLPGRTVVLQLDEPALPAVLSGDIPVSSGLRRIPAVHGEEARELLSRVLAVAGGPTVAHCCAARPPLQLLGDSGVDMVSLDVGLIQDVDLDDLAALLDTGVGLWAGVVPTAQPVDRSDVAALSRETAARVRRVWQRIGWAESEAAERTVLTPTCGLAGASQGWARQALAVAREAGGLLAAG